MSKKSERLGIIRRIINEELISSQDELIHRLGEYGIKATQSTLSRDFKSVNISKTPHAEKGYVYVLSETIVPDTNAAASNLDDAIVGIRFSHNICVIATKSGYASAVSTVLDCHKSKDILGTVAGDNCIIMIIAEGVEKKAIVNLLNKTFPAFKYLDNSDN